MYTGTLMGSWEGDIAKAMEPITHGVPGAADISAAWVRNLHRQYVSLLSSGYKAPMYVTPAGDENARIMLGKLKEVSGYSAPLVRAFLVSLYNLKQAGKIPPSKYDPFTYRQQEKLLTEVDPSWWDSAGKGLKAAGIGTLATVAGLGIAAYLFLKK